MSVNIYDSQSGSLQNIAAGQRTWIGTKAAYEAAKLAGTLPLNALICVTDDEDDTITDAVTKNDVRAVQSGAVYNALKPIDITSECTFNTTDYTFNWKYVYRIGNILIYNFHINRIYSDDGAWHKLATVPSCNLLLSDQYAFSDNGNGVGGTSSGIVRPGFDGTNGYISFKLYGTGSSFSIYGNTIILE